MQKESTKPFQEKTETLAYYKVEISVRDKSLQIPTYRIRVRRQQPLSRETTLQPGIGNNMTNKEENG